MVEWCKRTRGRARWAKSLCWLAGVKRVNISECKHRQRVQRTAASELALIIANYWQVGKYDWFGIQSAVLRSQPQGLMSALPPSSVSRFSHSLNRMMITLMLSLFKIQTSVLQMYIVIRKLGKTLSNYELPKCITDSCGRCELVTTFYVNSQCQILQDSARSS